MILPTAWIIASVFAAGDELGRRIAAAAPGETLVIPAGVYCEHLRIDKPLSLIAAKSGSVIIDGGGSGDIVEIAASNVTLKGFTIRNTGIDLDHENAGIRVLASRAVIEDNVLEDVLFGIDLREAPESVIRGNTIGGKDLDIARRGDGLRLWRSGDTLIEHNTFKDGRDAILWYSSGVTVRANLAERCRYGMHLMFSDRVVLEDNRLVENSVGIYLMYSTAIEIRRNDLERNRGPSGYGIGLKETDRFTVQDNVMLGNRVGVYIDGSPFTKAQPGTFTKNTIACNDVGVMVLPSAKGNEFYANNFIDNINQVSVAGRGSLESNAFWKGDIGNYWSDYTGYDQDGDGIGDFVHESRTLFESLMDKEPKLRLFLYSPAQQAIEFVGRAVPAVQPEAIFTDESPLMTPIAMAKPRVTESGAPMAASSLGLLAIGGALVWLGAAATRHSDICNPGGAHATKGGPL